MSASSVPTARLVTRGIISLESEVNNAKRLDWNARKAGALPNTRSTQEEGMLKSLIVVGAVLFAASAFAQGTQNQDPATKNAQPQTPAQTNAQGQQPVPGKTMQEKDTGLMNQSGGAPGATGSTGTQSGTTPTTGSTAK
jgi:hypothetical protein